MTDESLLIDYLIYLKFLIGGLAIVAPSKSHKHGDSYETSIESYSDTYGHALRGNAKFGGLSKIKPGRPGGVNRKICTGKQGRLDDRQISGNC